jgi:sulfatase maturation enzyme AslB (radical SAM superfamily)
MIHGGLELSFKEPAPQAQHCCLRNNRFQINTAKNFWHNNNFILLREKNKTGTWDPGCSNCQRLEASGHTSMRTGMNAGLEIEGKTELSGPARIDLMIDISCNLACRSCGTHSSTFWQKHLKEHGLWTRPIFSPRHSSEVIQSLQQLDLSNLRQVVFCGGETMLGQSYWDVADWLANNVPNAQQQLTVCFQTNGTQSISAKNINVIEKLHLVKLHVSLDGVGEKFEYLRWPATWNQVTDNILQIKQTAPSNVMFLIEETISIFNLWYGNELSQWVQQHFTTNREGDIVDHTKHLAFGDFPVTNCSTEYVAAMQDKSDRHLIPLNWSENPVQIRNMIQLIKQFDQLRNQSFEKTFPEVANFYSRYL